MHDLVTGFAEYIHAAFRHARYEVLEDGTYMATVESLQGVIAVGDTILKIAGTI